MFGRRLRAPLAALAAASGLAACGSSGPIVPRGHHETGAQIFASAGCAGCHVLKAAHATGDVGPNLNQLKPSYAAVVKQVRSGGGLMPSFGTSLTASQIAEVARFVADHE